MRQLLRSFPTHLDGPVPPLRTADVLVELLAAHGVELVFGLPGGPISPIHDALLARGLRHVTTSHESGALFAAAAYAQVTGRLAVAAVTSGPGVLNAITGLTSAYCDGLPVLLLVGEVPRKVQGRGALQDGSRHGLDVVAMTQHVSKLAVELTEPAHAPLVLRRAIALALSGRRGPVVITIPMDVATAELDAPQIAVTTTPAPSLDDDTAAELAALLEGAARPLIVAGAGTRGHGAPERLRALAERYRCPVATTPKAKGVFPDDHPLALGVVGLGGHPSVRAYAEPGLDVVLVLGSSLGDVATDGWSPLLRARRAFVHVDVDAGQIGRSYAATHAVVAPVTTVLDALLARPAPASGTARAAVPPLERLDSAAAIGGLYTPAGALAELQEVLPADTIYTVDSGDHFLFATHFLALRHPDAYLVMTGLGSMGQSLGGAIGVKLARPERAVVAICGDGCFAMSGLEVATAVAERLPIVVVVWNNQRMGMVERGHRAVYQRQVSYPIDLDLAALARGVGAEVVTAHRPGSLRAAAPRLRAPTRPVIVDLRVDPAIRPPARDRMITIDPGRA